MNSNKYLKKIPLFSKLTDVELEKIAKISKQEKFKKNEHIILEGEKGDKLYIITEGLVKIFRTSAFKKKILAFFKKGDFFGEISLIDGELRTASVYVVEDVEALTVSKKSFVKLLKDNPLMSQKIIELLCKRLRRANNEIDMLTFQNVLGRLSIIFLNLDKKYGKKVEEGSKIDLELTHQDLADMVGTSREVITRLLKDLKKQECIEMTDRTIVIKDKRKLKSWIC